MHPLPLFRFATLDSIDATWSIAFAPASTHRPEDVNEAPVVAPDPHAAVFLLRWSGP